MKIIPKMSNKYRYSKGASAPTWHDPVPEKKKRRNFRQWLYDYVNQAYSNNVQPEPIAELRTESFNKSFEGWNVRLHKANNGHIVEAWKNEDSGPNIHSNYRRPHELFMVRDDQEMGTALNDILVQLMLRG
jgi:hypothetical protein